MPHPVVQGIFMASRVSTAIYRIASTAVLLVILMRRLREREDRSVTRERRFRE